MESNPVDQPTPVTGTAPEARPRTLAWWLKAIVALGILLPALPCLFWLGVVLIRLGIVGGVLQSMKPPPPDTPRGEDPEVAWTFQVEPGSTVAILFGVAVLLLALVALFLVWKWFPRRPRAVQQTERTVG